MIVSVIQPLAPKNVTWQEVPVEGPMAASKYPVRRWIQWPQSLQDLVGISIMSAMEVVADEPGGEEFPQYHISVSCFDNRGKSIRPSRDMAYEVLAAFGTDGFEVDNHVPNSTVWNFWRHVADPVIGKPCVCVKDETLVIEGDYPWRPVKT